MRLIDNSREHPFLVEANLRSTIYDLQPGVDGEEVRSLVNSRKDSSSYKLQSHFRLNSPCELILPFMQKRHFDSLLSKIVTFLRQQKDVTLQAQRSRTSPRLRPKPVSSSNRMPISSCKKQLARGVGVGSDVFDLCKR